MVIVYSRVLKRVSMYRVDGPESCELGEGSRGIKGKEREKRCVFKVVNTRKRMEWMEEKWKGMDITVATGRCDKDLRLLAENSTDEGRNYGRNDQRI